MRVSYECLHAVQRRIAHLCKDMDQLPVSAILVVDVQLWRVGAESELYGSTGTVAYQLVLSHLPVSHLHPRVRSALNEWHVMGDETMRWISRDMAATENDSTGL